MTYEKQFQNHPLLIMNGFTGEDRQIQLMASMFQNMFPSINVTRVKLNTIRRCVLLNYIQVLYTVRMGTASIVCSLVNGALLGHLTFSQILVILKVTCT